VPYPVESPRFLWPTIGSFRNADIVFPVCTQSDIVGCTEEWNMMVVIHTDSCCTLTARSITRIPSQSETLFVYFISSSDCAFSVIYKRQHNNPLMNCQTSQFGDYNVRSARMTLLHAQTNHHVSHCCHWNQKFLTRNTIATEITFCSDTSSIITYCTSGVQVTYEPIQYVHLNPFPAW
jgi:hypothetical protein